MRFWFEVILDPESVYTIKNGTLDELLGVKFDPFWPFEHDIPHFGSCFWKSIFDEKYTTFWLVKLRFLDLKALSSILPLFLRVESVRFDHLCQKSCSVMTMKSSHF